MSAPPDTITIQPGQWIPIDECLQAADQHQLNTYAANQRNNGGTPGPRRARSFRRLTSSTPRRKAGG